MLAFLVTYFARLAISPVVPLIVDDFTVSNTAIGVALSGMWLAYGAAQFPSGVLADRYGGERRVILVAVGGTTAMSVVLALAPVFPAFVLAAVCLGLVAGLHYAVATTLLSRTFDDIGTVRASLRGRAARRARGARRRRVGSGSGTAGAPRSRWPHWSARRCSCCSRGVSARLSPGVPTSRCGSGSRSRHSSNSSRARASSSRCSSRWSARTWCRV